MSFYNSPKFLVRTFGCQANIADSNTMTGMLEALGMEEISDLPNEFSEKEALKQALVEADLFIVNTCSVRQKSDDKVYGLGRIYRELKDEKKKIPFTVMAGCMVGSVTGERKRYLFNELRKKTPWVDEYINPSQLEKLPRILLEKEVLGEWARKKVDKLSLAIKESNYEDAFGNSQLKDRHAFVNISYGCDNYCRFCVVPYARGKEISRPKEEILSEINHLIKRGVTELTLCGQNVNSWGMDMSQKFEVRAGSSHKIPFVDLLKQIHEIPEIQKITFISSNPFDFGQELIDTIGLPKISDYLHIALQSGNNEILKKMNRRHTVEEFIDLAGKLRKVKPGLELGTDFIVGFPGETRKQFEDTLEIVNKIKFNVAFISMYSPRKGTPADKMYLDDIPLKEKKKRHEELTKVWKESIN